MIRPQRSHHMKFSKKIFWYLTDGTYNHGRGGLQSPVNAMKRGF